MWRDAPDETLPQRSVFTVLLAGRYSGLDRRVSAESSLMTSHIRHASEVVPALPTH